MKKISEYFLNLLPENNRYERIWKLAQVDFKKRYFNTRLGLFWAFINPVFRLFIYLFVFTWLGKMRRENFGFYIFGALIVWIGFVEATNKGIKLLTAKRYLIENIQFNKIDLFISSTLSVFLGLLFNMTAYLIISLLFGIPIFKEIIWLPLLLFNLYLLCMGGSMILAVISIYFKDITHLWAILVMLGFWTIPAIFPLESFTGKLKILLFINPVGSLIINFRNALLYGESMDYMFLVYGMVYALLIFIIGQFLLKRHWQNALEYA